MLATPAPPVHYLPSPVPGIQIYPPHTPTASVFSFFYFMSTNGAVEGGVRGSRLYFSVAAAASIY